MNDLRSELFYKFQNKEAFTTKILPIFTIFTFAILLPSFCHPFAILLQPFKFYIQGVY